MRLTREALKRYGNIIKKELRDEINRKKLKATGNLSKDITFRTKSLKDSDVLQIFLLKYAEYLNTGTGSAKKGSDSKTNNRYTNLLAWAKTKGNLSRLPENKMKKAVYAISRSIGKKGIIKRFRGGSKFIDLVIEKVSPQLTKDIAEAYLKDISNEIDKSIK